MQGASKYISDALRYITEWNGAPCRVFKEKTMKFNTLYEIRTRDGQTYKAKLIKLNKYAGKQTLWRREGDVPHKQRYLRPDEVVEVSLI